MAYRLGKWLTSSYRACSEFLYLFGRTLQETATPPFRGSEFVRQLYFYANQSAPIIAICVSFAAMVTVIESSFHMKLVVQNDSLVPGFAALLILRELGAVLAALLATSRVGAGLAAEVGSMQVTEQIDALKMLGIDPIRFLVVPRFWAGVLGGIVLTVIANSVCVMSAVVVSNIKLGYSFGSFMVAMNRFVHFQDLIFAIIKGAIFGGTIPLVSCYHGFRCKAGAEGVGLATTNSVVTSSVSIIVWDFFLTWIFSHFY